MTAPTFDLIPVPNRNALANPPPPAGSQAATIDTNFTKINPWLSGRTQAWGWETRHPGSIQYAALPYWAGMQAWPTAWITVPDCSYLILTMSCLLDQVPTDSITRIGIVCSGFPGLSYNTPTFYTTTRANQAGGLQSAAVTGMVSRANLNVGANVGILPAYFVESGATWIALGLLTVTAVA